MQNYNSNHHIAEFLIDKINKIVKKIGVNKIGAIVSDNAFNIVAAREAIALKYPNIINLRCIAYCFNLFSQDIIKIPFAKKLFYHYNTVIPFFKVLHIVVSLLHNMIKKKLKVKYLKLI